jgi:hypothetical protein
MSCIECCKDCKTRYEACHDTCETYIEQKRAHLKRKQQIDKERKLQTGLTTVAIEGSQRMRKIKKSGKWR